MDHNDPETSPLLPPNNKQSESLKDVKPHLKPLLAAFFISLVAGLNDGSIGTIIPRLKQYYQIPNETISLLFLCSAFGFFASAGMNGTIVHRLGQLKTLYLGSTSMLVAFFVLSWGVPFPVMICIMPFVGGGMALLDAAMNVYVANIPLATLMLNILHAVYGVGAMISPLVASFLLKYNISWKGMYVFLTAVAILNIIFITLGFWDADFNEVQGGGQEEEVTVHDDASSHSSNSNSSNSVKYHMKDHKELTKKAIFNRVTLIGAVYILVYVGVEVTLGGWGYSFLKEGRGGDKIAMAQVVSGYWAGLAAGRVILGYLSGRFGEKLMITLFTIMIIGALFIMIISKDIVFDSAALISIGLLLGPMFPTTISLASKALPRSYHATSIGFMAA
ncbi:MAG: major facilitator superfamily domain-containing protein [Benjaminiella poitrasii]|nr:MAG: major facilitator superfamily domain-containing protein [Benjaminiella poitrasii]